MPDVDKSAGSVYNARAFFRAGVRIAGAQIYAAVAQWTRAPHKTFGAREAEVAQW